jgi:hypothetical protein
MYCFVKIIKWKIKIPHCRNSSNRQPYHIYIWPPTFLACYMHLYEIWRDLTSLMAPNIFWLECLYQAMKMSDHVYVSCRVYILHLHTIILLDFRTIPTVWYFVFFICIISIYTSLLELCNAWCSWYLSVVYNFVHAELFFFCDALSFCLFRWFLELLPKKGFYWLYILI